MELYQERSFFKGIVEKVMNVMMGLIHSIEEYICSDVTILRLFMRDATRKKEMEKYI